jgi:hypothetical protein
VCGDGVGIHDRGAAACDHGPDTAFGVEDGEFKRCASRGIEFLDVGLFLCEVTAKRGGPNHRWATVSGHFGTFGDGSCGSAAVHGEVACNCPFWTAYAFCSLVEFCGHVKIVNGGLFSWFCIETDEGVYFEVGKVEVDIDGVETGEKVDESITLFLGDVCEECLCDRAGGRQRGTDGDVEDECLCIDIANIHAALVCEEDRVAFASRGDADVVLCVGRVRKERLYDESVESARDRLDL